jgi:hypothetical protein
MNKFTILLVVLFSCYELILNEENVEFSKFLVWGPGLEPGFNLPVRYFFIKAVNTQLKK